MGIYDQPDYDHTDRYDPEWCERCKQSPCECCRECGVPDDVACEPWCGLRDYETDEQMFEQVMEVQVYAEQ